MKPYVLSALIATSELITKGVDAGKLTKKEIVDVPMVLLLWEPRERQENQANPTYCSTVSLNRDVFRTCRLFKKYLSNYRER
jgi:hypothetical protein